MDITTNLDGCFEFQQIGLLQENISRHKTQLLDLGFRQLDLLPGSASNVEKPADNIIKNRLFHFFSSSS
uniref:Serine/threonine-protein phosphatase PP1-like isoform X1 n=1 Tax=Rhizophora mucronata TaxID=61149 RepID=A0A2P2JA38_RHIMU